MSVKVVIRRTIQGTPIEVEAELNDVKQIRILEPILKKLGELVDGWRVVEAKRRRRAYQKHWRWSTHETLEAMSHAKTFLFKKEIEAKLP